MELRGNKTVRGIGARSHRGAELVGNGIDAAAGLHHLRTTRIDRRAAFGRPVRSRQCFGAFELAYEEITAQAAKEIKPSPELLAALPEAMLKSMSMNRMTEKERKRARHIKGFTSKYRGLLKTTHRGR